MVQAGLSYRFPGNTKRQKRANAFLLDNKIQRGKKIFRVNLKSPNITQI